MRIAYAFLASSAEYTQDGRLWMLGGDIDSLHVPHIPATHPLMTLVFKLVVSPLEREQDHRVLIKFIRPDNTSFRDNVEFGLDVLKEVPFPEKDSGYAFPLTFAGLTFESEGQHSIQILIDDVELQALPLTIVYKPPDGNQEDVRG